VNGWPRFTVTYPKDWVEEIPSPGEVFRATSPDPPHNEKFIINVSPKPQPLNNIADYLLLFWKNVAKDATVVSNKPSRLRDGTPAQEVEIQMVMNDLPLTFFYVSTRNGDMGIGIGVASSPRGRIKVDLKVIPYSLEFQPGKDEPVKLPPDIQEFLDKHCSNLVSHDLAKAMTDFSDRYLHSGVKKGEMERFYRQFIGSITSWEVGITDLVPEGDKAYVAGFLVVNGAKAPFVGGGMSIIKENGEWKWYGNQRDASP
jgi:hypothetical protein